MKCYKRNVLICISLFANEANIYVALGLRIYFADINIATSTFFWIRLLVYTFPSLFQHFSIFKI